MESADVLQILPLHIRNNLRKSKVSMENIQEIRLRIGQPVLIIYKNHEFYLGREHGLEHNKNYAYVFSKEELRQAMEYISNYSLYAYEQQLKSGYITIKGGHRIGIAGNVILDHGEVKSIRHISSLNIRVAHEVKDCASVLKKKCMTNDKLESTLIIAPPGRGKTTLLRDFIRIISNMGETVGVVDERSEIGASFLGVPQNDLGIRTDILDGCSKGEGMIMLIRSMAPNVIAVDEVGTKEDVDGLLFCANRGSSIVATMHGTTFSVIVENDFFRPFVTQKIFKRYVILNGHGQPGAVWKILDENGVRIC